MPTILDDDISRLPDGRLFGFTDDDDVFVLVDGAWVPAEDVTVAAATESIPLTAEEIAELRSRGVLPT